MSLLSVRNLVAGYGSAPVLHGVSLDVPEGSFVAVIGANTAGKSTLLRAISGLLKNVSGQIVFNGQEILGAPADRMAQLGIAHVPEGRHVFPKMTVQENLLLGMYATHKALGSRETQSRLNRIYTLFPRLQERRRQYAGTLSGGEQQMVALGRALVLAPKLLMLDEPSHGLAPRIVEELHSTLADIHRTGQTILLIEQNTQLALSVADRAFVLQSGMIVLQGASEDLLKDSRVRTAYLGI
ncbi:MAG: ABC transporter ATP-binding protein [Castellaniella sp.]|uniref:ABC transporter ATP-binding protein n=1 Tax=Castellaniella sp. TaxID=1955812 RepID=UPI00121BCD43|nr:ABC transporter ATP-binding protein [Castellaniella sp.]TAN29978.1 MAG: ABC transporter ATP-binding protein [Castellaniella sp.]